MRRDLFLFVTFLFFVSNLSAQWSRVGFKRSFVPCIHLKDNSLFTKVDTTFYRSDNNGESWDPIGILNTPFIDDLESIGAIFFAVGSWTCAGFCYPMPCIYRSRDNGDTWESVYSAKFGASQVVENQGVVFTNIMGGLFASEDYGTTWNKVVPYPPSPPEYNYLFANKGVLYTSGYMDGIYKTIDNGLTWTLISGNLPNAGVYMISANDSFLFAAEESGVFRSNDGGIMWQPISSGLPLGQIVFAVTSSNKYLCVAYQKTIYFSQNNGSTWINISEGFDLGVHGIISGMVINGDYLIITSDDGIWRFDFSTVLGIKKVFGLNNPNYFRLQQNYPNPFNPTTTIDFDIPMTSEVTLKIFNILVEEVATLVSDRLTAGTYSYEWDAGNLASGVYLYRLEAGDYVKTRKMVLMR